MQHRLLFLNEDGLTHPWAELGLPPPKSLVLEGCALLKAHEWKAEASPSPVTVILVDIDVVGRTEPLDDWALHAWKRTFNELILKALQPSGEAPLLFAYTRQPSWEQAVLALRIGARDIAKLSKLKERLEILIPSLMSESALSLEFSPAPPLLLPTASAEPRPEAPRSSSIPRHAIPFPIEGLEGSSAAIEHVRNLIRKTAPLETSVLITGPTGSGKERVARALHRYSARAQGPFVAVNCGAISPGLFESELFGHLRGAFTGATDDQKGLLVAAEGGTLFLDEVSELPLSFQVKLLRSLQERSVTPVGAAQSQPLNFRLIAATQKDLSEEIEQGSFREDLLYRLRVMDIQLPALRERRPDMNELSRSVLKKITKKAKRPLLQISEAVLEKLLLYSWPGNIRELENVLEHAATLCWGEGRVEIEVGDLPESVQRATMESSKSHELKEAVRLFEQDYIRSAVRRLGSKETAAESLGLSLATLYRKLGS